MTNYLESRTLLANYRVWTLQANYRVWDPAAKTEQGANIVANEALAQPRLEPRLVVGFVVVGFARASPIRCALILEAKCKADNPPSPALSPQQDNVQEDRPLSPEGNEPASPSPSRAPSPQKDEENARLYDRTHSTNDADSADKAQNKSILNIYFHKAIILITNLFFRIVCALPKSLKDAIPGLSECEFEKTIRAMIPTLSQCDSARYLAKYQETCTRYQETCTRQCLLLHGQVKH